MFTFSGFFVVLDGISNIQVLYFSVFGSSVKFGQLELQKPAKKEKKNQTSH